MRLAPHYLAWLYEAEALARRHNWPPFVQSLKNQRQHDPSMLLARGGELLAVWMRTSKPDRDGRLPDLDRFADRGIEGVLVIEEDWASRANLEARLL